MMTEMTDPKFVTVAGHLEMKLQVYASFLNLNFSPMFRNVGRVAKKQPGGSSSGVSPFLQQPLPSWIRSRHRM